MISSLTYSTGGFTENSSWTLGLDLTQVDPMYLSDREEFDDWTDGPDYATTYMNPRWGAAVQMQGFGADTATYRPSTLVVTLVILKNYQVEYLETLVEISLKFMVLLITWLISRICLYVW